MGYTAKFEGRVKLEPRLTMEQYATLCALAEAEPGDKAQHLPIATGDPGLKRPERSYCQWTPTKDGLALEWDEGEKFYYYVEWLQYICAWLQRQGVRCDGEIKWRGESCDDAGTLVVKANVVEAVKEELVVMGRTKLGTLRAALAKIAAEGVDRDLEDEEFRERANMIARKAIELVE